MDNRTAWIGAGATVAAALIGLFGVLAVAPDNNSPSQEATRSTTQAPVPPTPSSTSVSIPPAIPTEGEQLWSGELNAVKNEGFNFRSGEPKAGGDGTYQVLILRDGKIRDGIVSGARAYGSWGGETSPTYRECKQTIVQNAISASEGLPATTGRAYCIDIDEEIVLYFKILSVSDQAMRVSVTTWRAS